MSDERRPAKVFRDNLRRLAGAHGLDFDTLASTLGAKGENKKWLGRLWENGLNRPDKRKRRHLEQLAGFLGIDFSGGMWIPNVEANPTVIFDGDKSRWLRLTGTIYECLIALKHMWNRFPKEMREIMSVDNEFIYKDQFVITCWATHRYGYKLEGSEQLLVEDLEKLSERLDKEFGAAVEYEEESSFQQKVFDRMTHHPAWSQVEKLANEEEPGWQQHDPGFIQQKLSQHLMNVTNQPPSVEEVFQRFASHYLDPLLGDSDKSSEPTIASDPFFSKILDDLRTHQKWFKHVEIAFDGDYQEAEKNVLKMWKKAQEQFNNNIEIDSFVSFFRSNILDDLNPDRFEKKPK